MARSKVQGWIVADPALESLDAALEFRKNTMSQTRMQAMVDKIFAEIDRLVQYPGGGAIEEQLAHLGLGHRRVVVGHFKIIYRVVEDRIWVSDIFDSRQDPEKMKA